MDWVAFEGLGIGKIHLNSYFLLFGFKVYWYGIIIGLGIFLALIYAIKKAHKFGVDKDKLIDVTIIGIIGGIVGARLYYVAFSIDNFLESPLSIFYIRSGGLAIYGGIIGAVIVGYIGCRWRKIPFLPMLDLAAIGFLIGQAVGRWGNFINIEAYGTHTDLPWAMSGSKIPSSISPVHPAFLYESLWCILGFILLNLFIKHRKFDGQITLLYLIWYGTERAIVEGIRTDSLWLMPGIIKVSQLLSIIFVISSSIILFYKLNKIKKDDKSYLYINKLKKEKVENNVN